MKKMWLLLIAIVACATAQAAPSPITVRMEIGRYPVAEYYHDTEPDYQYRNLGGWFQTNELHARLYLTGSRYKAYDFCAMQVSYDNAKTWHSATLFALPNGTNGIYFALPVWTNRCVLYRYKQ